MDLNRDAQIDTSQVEDERGTGGGLGRLPIPVGGRGIVGLVVTLLVVLLGGGYAGSQLLGGGSGGQGGGADNSRLAQECSTANPSRLSNLDCRNVLYINSVQDFWQGELPRVFGTAYQKADTVFFSQQAQTGCGAADTGVGPFYCAQDAHVYIDLSFYQELANRFGAQGQFPQAYVLAHEYGHHVQDLVGTLPQVNRLEQTHPAQANQYSVMLELQADCYAGVWARHATQTRDASGRPIFVQVTGQDIQDAVDTAGAIGDDAIARQAGQRADQRQFTHGSSAQREQWLTTGYQTGDPKACDTFGGTPH